MSLVPLRRRRPLARILVAGALAAFPVGAAALPEVVAVRGLPSSVAAEYGAAVPLDPPHTPGTYAIATRWGIEVRNAASPADPPVGTFRTSGTVRSLAVRGEVAYLFAGNRGIVAVDLSDASDLTAIGALGDLGNVTAGAVSGAGDALAAASDQGLHFIAIAGPGALAFRSTRTYADAREVRAVEARADSFLVASERISPTRRLFLTLYRFPAGAVEPESLREFSVPLQAPSALVWLGDLAFLATGNSGVTVVDIRTGATRTTPAGGSRFVRDLDVNDSLVVATLSAAGLGKFRRSGAAGDTLVGFTSENLQLEPTRVTLTGSRVVVSTQSALSSEEPDEIGRSAIELRDLDTPGAVATLGGTGRTRRVAIHQGYAYVADYVGGLRVYRADGPDTSLVGVLPVSGFSRVVDVALDPPRGRAYLAAMSGGLQIVDISDPSSPALLSSHPLSDQVSAVAVIDSTLVVAGRRGISSPGISFVDVTLPTAPLTRGELSVPLGDPRAIAVKDTIAFVADATLGLYSVGFRDPDSPGMVGTSSGFAARDLHLSGNQLLVGTRSAGLQIVDVFQPSIPILRSTLPTPSIHGVSRSGNSAVLFLGENEALVVDISDPFAPASRGPIAVPGVARDGTWVGDTLVVAASFSIERFRVNPAASVVPALQITVDPEVLLPKARISWSVAAPAGLVGWNLYRDVLTSPASATQPLGVRVNGPLLPAGTSEIVDETVPSGVPLRYRLEGFFEDGSARKLAEGSTQLTVAPAVGLAFPNPYTPDPGLVTVPFTVSLSEHGPIEGTVHDAHGRVVRDIEVAPPSGGFGAVVWDGRNSSGRAVSSGIYFIRIRGPGLDRAIRVVLVR
jgi:hypothetical protein